MNGSIPELYLYTEEIFYAKACEKQQRRSVIGNGRFNHRSDSEI